MKRSSFGQTPVTLLVGLGTAALVGAGGWALSRRGRSGERPRERSSTPELVKGKGLHVKRVVTVLCSPAELYAEWRDLTHWPGLMPTVRSVTVLDEKRSHWVASGPADMPVEWDAVLVADEPDRFIAWCSAESSDVENAGSVQFTPAPGGRGTEVRVSFMYAPPAGRLGAATAAVFGRGADRQIREGLRRFKQRMETNEVAVAAAPIAPSPAEARKVA